MDFHGLVKKFEVNRPLLNWEISRQLPPSQPKVDKPWGQLSVIKMNSTYLECVDKFFADKGILSAYGLTASGIVILFVLATLIGTIEDWSRYASYDKRASIFFLIFVSAICSGAFLFFRYMFSKELFRFTHYPIRFNRKNRMVYVTRLDGTVMVESWDRLFFTEGTGGDGTRDIRGHRLAEDGITVLETFALPVYGSKKSAYRFSFWEFVRRYMEEGPEKLMTRVEWTIDISDRRESFWQGFQFHYLDAASVLGAGAVFLFPVILWYAIGRWIAMHTSKIPVWPAEVEAACQIEPNDPYLVDREHLPPPMDKD